MVKTTKLLSTLVLFITAIFFSACSDSAVKPGAANDVSSSIPTDASGVMLMNVKSMMNKADYPAFQQTELFASFLKDVEKENPALVPFVKDPAAAGVDITGNMGMYFKASVELDKSDFAILLPVADAAKAKAAITELLKDEKNVTTTDKEGYTLYTIEKNAYLVQSDRIVAFTTFGEDAKVKTLVTPEGNGIRDNKKFTDQIPTGKDIVYWLDTDPIVESIMSDPKTKSKIEGSLALANIPVEGLNNNSLYGFSDFLKGKSEGELNFTFSEELQAELGELVADEMAVNYAKYLPEGNLGGAFSIGVNGKGVLSFLTKRGLDQQVDQQLAMLGLSLGKIEEGITGDLAAGVYPPAEGSSEPSMVAALGLKDKAFMEQVMATPPLSMFMPKEGENYVFSRGQDMMGNEMPKFYARIVDEALVISNNPALFEQALAGKTNKNIKPLQEGWLGMFIDYTVLADNFDVIARAMPLSPIVLSQMSENIKHQDVTTAYVIGKGAKTMFYSNHKDKSVNTLKSSWMTWDKMHKDGAFDALDSAPEDDMDSFEEEFEETTTKVEQM
ncbi:MAG: DUF4836 family protein [Aureispira sp.]